MDYTILIAEDEDLLRKLLETIVTRANICVLAARNAKEALQISEQHPGPIDMLLSDIQMPPGMNGLDVAKQIRLARPLIKVLLISGFVDGALILNHGWCFVPGHHTASRSSKRAIKPVMLGAHRRNAHQRKRACAQC